MTLKTKIRSAGLDGCVAHTISNVYVTLSGKGPIYTHVNNRAVLSALLALLMQTLFRY
jgi:hypothetical protein